MVCTRGCSVAALVGGCERAHQRVGLGAIAGQGVHGDRDVGRAAASVGGHGVVKWTSVAAVGHQIFWEKVPVWGCGVLDCDGLDLSCGVAAIVRGGERPHNAVRSWGSHLEPLHGSPQGRCPLARCSCLWLRARGTPPLHIPRSRRPGKRQIQAPPRPPRVMNWMNVSTFPQASVAVYTRATCPTGSTHPPAVSLVSQVNSKPPYSWLALM